jgi:hypothetical protein
VSLVELAGRIRAASQDQEELVRRRAAAPEAAGPAVNTPVVPGAAAAAPRSASLVEAKPLGALVGERLAAGRQRARTSPANAPSRPASTARVPAARRPSNAASKRGRPVAETRRLAAELVAEQPDATPDDIARELGITTTRLKRVLSAV